MPSPRQLLHYRVTRKLGEGGMGEVWQATDTTLERDVAIKLLPDDLSGDPERLARFEREAKILASLNHPNIATIHGLHEAANPSTPDRPTRFLAMELVDGRPLSALIPSSGLSVQRLFDLAIPLADALGAAHDRGITHRDLKPDNVMVTDEGRVKVLDFGLAKLAHESPADGEAQTALATATVTQEGRIVGTVNYMSPEQSEGKPVDARSDVFSLGIVLYEMATGRRPFSGDTPISTISSILKDQPPSLIELKADLPRHLDRVVRRCLAKDPERRYPNAKEVRNELEELRAEIDSGISGSVSISTPAPPRRPSAAPASRTPRWLMPIALLAVLAVAAVLIGMLASRYRPGEAPTVSAPARPGDASVATTATSIAVLPFVDLSPEGDREYFGDGIAEELINRLARVEGLRVAGRTSSFAFKGQDADLRVIGESLGVETVIEGSVRSAGEQVRVTAQLVGVADGFQLWSSTYDRGLSDIFAVQDEIASSIVRALRETLGGEAGLGEAEAEPMPTADVEAYQLYLKARHLYQQRTGESIERAIELYGEAIERDPGFARAWAGLASAWHVAPGYTERAEDEVRPRLLEAAQRALQLDPDLAEAHATVAGVHSQTRRWVDAETGYLRALELEPANSTTLLWYGGMLAALGRVEDGARALERAYEIDPASGVINGWLGHMFRARGDDEAAVRWMREADRLGWGAGPLWVAVALFEAGDDDGLIEFLEQSKESDPEGIASIRRLREAERNPDLRPAVLRELGSGEFDAVSFEACLRMDGLDEAFAILDEFDRDTIRPRWMLRLWGPRAADLRRDPRFGEWATRMGLPEYWKRYGWPEGCRAEGDGVRCR